MSIAGPNRPQAGMRGLGWLLPVMLGGAIMQGSTGLLHTIIPLRMTFEGFETRMIGLVGSAYALGFGAGCVLLPSVVRGTGAVRTFVLAAVACALTVLAMIGAETAAGWIALRFMTGLAIAAIFTLPEAWVGQLTPEGSHGRSFALSALMARVALVLAPLTPQILAIEEPGLFILSAIGAIAACVPILLAPAVRPKGKPVVLSAERMGLRQMLRRVPTATLGCAVSGLLGGPVFTFAPLFGLQNGFDKASAGILLTAIYGGGFLMQYPLGMASDRMRKAQFLTFVSLSWAAVSITLATLDFGGAHGPLIMLMALWGGLSSALYSTSVADACEKVGPDAVIPAMSTLLIAWSIGAGLGPLIALMAMQGESVRGLFTLASVAALGFAAFATFARRR